MKSFLSACVAAVILAVGAWVVLEQVQIPVEKAFTTTSARI